MLTCGEFATADPTKPDHIGEVFNLIGGVWQEVPAHSRRTVIDPMNGNPLFKVPMTPSSFFEQYREQLARCPKSGRHNPLHNVERYRLLGKVSAQAASALAEPEIEAFFAKLVMRVMPKSYAQCLGEVRVVQQGLANFSGDQVRFLATGFMVPGDHRGQETRGYRWPFGPVAIIAPFNFPLEIPALQLMGALYMGNLPLLKVDSKVSIVMDQFLRLLHRCGLPMEDVIFLNCTGPDMGRFLEQSHDVLRLVQFTGSTAVAEQVSKIMSGRVRIEDAGFDWKILGPDASFDWLEYVAWQCDQDAYAASGQKCSAQSLLFVHDHWNQLGLKGKLREFASRRRLEDHTSCPVLTWNNTQIQRHVDEVLQVPGAQLLFGGQPYTGHTIPECYGAYQPTAILVPLKEASRHFELVTKEVFGPFQIIIDYGDDELGLVLALMERLQHHLTAAVVSEDQVFQDKVLGATVNGTTYTGIRARTTGAPQNHWFGPAGDPRAAGIGTPGAIISTWSCHREIVSDRGPLPAGWKLPPPT